MKSFIVDMYYDQLLAITRGSYCGHVINAKPILLLSIVSLIEQHVIIANRVLYDDRLMEEYSFMFAKYSSDKKTPMYKPFVFMAAEPFYHLKWKSPQNRLPNDSSTKFVRDNIEYAYLDNALWDLLQDEKTRNFLKDSIINYYMK